MYLYMDSSEPSKAETNSTMYLYMDSEPSKAETNSTMYLYMDSSAASKPKTNSSMYLYMDSVKVETKPTKTMNQHPNPIHTNNGNGETIEDVLASLKYGFDAEATHPNPKFADRRYPEYKFNGNAAGGFAHQFQSRADMLNFLGAESQPSTGLTLWVSDSALMNKGMEIFAADEIPWEDVMLTCHDNHPDDLYICHRPLKTQNFVLAEVQTKSGNIGKVMFTEHLMRPDCQKDCM